MALACTLASCGGPKGPTPPPKLEKPAPDFVAELNKELVPLAREGNAAGWTQSTNITVDTQYLNARVTERTLEFFNRKSAEAKAYDNVEMDAPTKRSLMLLKLGVSAPAPSDAAKRAELATLGTELEAMYGEGKYCPLRQEGGKTVLKADKDEQGCFNLDALSDVHGHQPELRRAHRGLGWLAHDLAPHARQVPALRRALERRREGARLRRHGRDVALALRHAGRRTSRRKPRASTRRSSRCTRACIATRA